MPHTIAVIGASSNPEKYGNMAVRAWKQAGWTVYPVNPNEQEIEGLRAYRSIKDIPGEVQVATMYVPPPLGLRIADRIIAKGVREVYLNPGAGSPELRDKLEAAGIEVHEACSIMASRSRPAGGGA
ncbi:MAG: CoA-binding protein [Armatimonadota bacterium]